MNCRGVNFEDEPRKVPKPIPYSQSSLIHPTVPDVSLILQEAASGCKSPSKTSFSGTEFQTYNAWRWKNVNEKEKEKDLSAGCKNVPRTKKDEFFPINDKFSGSDIERRKNEILYGGSDEPRRPLPPRPIPVIPQCIGASFSDASFNNECWVSGDESKDNVDASRGFKNFAQIDLHPKPESEKIEKSLKNNSGSNDIGDLYRIISEQNKQMVSLQKQIENLLRSQETKERHIEQLLKSQETKENKIEQLLKIQDMKEKHIEQLLKAQEKHERQIQHLIQTQDANEKQRFEELKQLKEAKADVASVGTMTKVELLDKSTNTSMCNYSKNEVDKARLDDTNADQSLFDSRTGTRDRSLTLNSLHLPAIREHVPSPQSSIHIEIPEYVGSSDEESEAASSASKDVFPRKQNDGKSLGYTFYNNVLTQVNDIIRGNEDKENEVTVKKRENYEKCALELEKSYLHKYTCLRENHLQMMKPTMAAAAADGLKKLWDVDVANDGAPVCPAREPKASKMDYNPSPSDISLKMNALALKYLKQEQISQYDVQPQSQQSCRQPDVTIYNVTNLSFGTMRYLERYRISSNESGKVFNPRSNQDVHSPHKFLRQKAKAAIGSCERFNNL